MYIDTHCHISKKYYEDIDEVIALNKQNGIEKMIVSFCEKEGMEEAFELANCYEEVYLSLGYHPQETGKVTEEDLKLLEEKLKNKKVVALGEIGLDYHYGKEDSEKQKNLFRRQLEIATSFNLPVIIHSRDATKDTIELLKEYSTRGIIHCFSGSYETAMEYIKLGYLLGIGGVVTFQNSNLKEVVKKLPLTSLVLETDSPYLAPVPHRGEVNSSKNIPIIAEKIASLKEIPVEEVMKKTNENVNRLFDF